MHVIGKVRNKVVGYDIGYYDRKQIKNRCMKTVLLVWIVTFTTPTSIPYGRKFVL